MLIALSALLCAPMFVMADDDEVKPPKQWTKNGTLVEQGIQKLFDRFDVDRVRHSCANGAYPIIS